MFYVVKLQLLPGETYKITRSEMSPNREGDTKKQVFVQLNSTIFFIPLLNVFTLGCEKQDAYRNPDSVNKITITSPVEDARLSTTYAFLRLNCSLIHANGPVLCSERKYTVREAHSRSGAVPH